LLELILPKITDLRQLPPSLKFRRLNRRRQGKGVKGEKELPPPPLLARPASRDSHCITLAQASLPFDYAQGKRSAFACRKIFAKRKGGIIYSFPCPARPCAENIFAPKTNLAKMVENGQVQAGKSNFQARFWLQFPASAEIFQLGFSGGNRRFSFPATL